MFIDYSPEQQALQSELRGYFAELMAREDKDSLRGSEGGETYRRIVRQMGKDGWLGVGFPKEYGGQGRTALEQFIFIDELRRAGAPLPFVTLSTVGPALMELGSEEQKAEYIPRILAGEVHFAIGYSEPEAGTDLASLTTSAVKDGDEYVINGTKIFTSGAHDADYIWLAARTSTEGKKHHGITIFILDTRDPGFSTSFIHTIGEVSTCMSYYENCRVPERNIVGGVNGGWKLITSQLNHERVGLAAFGGLALKHFDDTLAWARETEAEDGQPVAEKPWAQIALGEAKARLDAMRLMNWRMAWQLEQGPINPAQASAVKVYGTEAVIEVYRLLLNVLGSAGAVRRGSAAEALHGDLELNYRVATINTFGGGINEIQREIVSMAGLRMPRVPR
jgi:alkylation response protein AidB-like acyl-CoA dehydrogenase